MGKRCPRLLQVGLALLVGFGLLEKSQNAFDRCPIDDAMVNAYSTALGEFDRLSRDGKLTATAQTFAKKSRWFGRWVKIALASHDTREASAQS